MRSKPNQHMPYRLAVSSEIDICCAWRSTELIQGAACQEVPHTYLGVHLNGVIKLSSPQLRCPSLALQVWNWEGNPHPGDTVGKETLWDFALISEGYFLFSLWVIFSCCPPVYHFATPSCSPTHLLSLSQCECWKFSLTSLISTRFAQNSDLKE